MEGTLLEGRLTVQLMYESADGSIKMPLVKVTDAALAKAVGIKAVETAMQRANHALTVSPRLCREGYIEADRIRTLLSSVMSLKNSPTCERAASKSIFE